LQGENVLAPFPGIEMTKIKSFSKDWDRDDPEGVEEEDEGGEEGVATAPLLVVVDEDVEQGHRPEDERLQKMWCWVFWPKTIWPTDIWSTRVQYEKYFVVQNKVIAVLTKYCVCQLPVDQLPVDQLPVDQLPVDQLPVDQLAFDQMSDDQMSYDQISFE
jgi:hypothetical protein